MGRRILILIGIAAAISLFIVGVAMAAGGIAPSDETTLSTATTMPGDTDTTTAPVSTDTTVPGDVTSTTAAGDDGPGDTTHTSCTHPANFGGTICSLRHAGDHTPAAEIKGKHVKGWEKKHPCPTTTTTMEVNP